jgi:hypothetical protein
MDGIVAPRVDKYGRRLADDHDTNNLRRFYRLEDDSSEQPEPGPDYARGQVLLESSDEEDDRLNASEDEESDVPDVVALGIEQTKRASAVVEDEDVEIDLDEDNFADLDAQAAAYSKTIADAEENVDDSTVRTRRLAVVNLDWDHVRSVHLFKIFDSVLSLSTGASSSTASIVRGKILSVRVYPSQFGKDRMAREEREGPPVELFKKKESHDDEEINATNIYETGDAEEYDEDALRKYQLERLRCVRETCISVALQTARQILLRRC